jgi:hypothetical protein
MPEARLILGIACLCGIQAAADAGVIQHLESLHQE